MAEPKTQATHASVAKFIAAQPEPRRSECATVAGMMRKATGAEPRMWGSSIVGFGTQTYVYASGRTGDWPLIAFSPRKAALTLYLMLGAGKRAELLARLGKYKMSKGCLYVNKLGDVDSRVLQALITAAAADRKALAPASEAAKKHVAATPAKPRAVAKPAKKAASGRTTAAKPAGKKAAKKSARRKASPRARSAR